MAGEALRIVQQHLQQVLRREALVALAQGQRLRRLDEAARPLGVFLEVHGQLPLPCGPLSSAAHAPARSGTGAFYVGAAALHKI